MKSIINYMIFNKVIRESTSFTLKKKQNAGCEKTAANKQGWLENI